MKKLHSFIAIKITLICSFACLISAVAMPKYIGLNKKVQANTCKANQIIVETTLAVAYADNLAKGIDAYPKTLTPGMFEDGKIPICPIDGTPISFNPKTGKASCPHHLNEHSRSMDN